MKEDSGMLNNGEKLYILYMVLMRRGPTKYVLEALELSGVGVSSFTNVFLRLCV